MKEPVWLNREDCFAIHGMMPWWIVSTRRYDWQREDCLAIHEMMRGQHGGLPGVRDEGLLDSALARPRNLLAHGSPSLPDLAAGYAVGIILNHPFLDGNKRTGFMLAATFLESNGLIFEATEESVVEKTLALAAGKAKQADYAAWLKANSRKR
jgi:death-on-curing protein